MATTNTTTTATTTSTETITYAVRKPGHCAWASDLTLAAARRACRLANDMCGDGHIIVPSAPLYKVCTFGRTNETAARSEVHVPAAAMIQGLRSTYRSLAEAVRVAEQATRYGSCTCARVAKCDTVAAVEDADISDAGGRDWRWVR